MFYPISYQCRCFIDALSMLMRYWYFIDIDFLSIPYRYRCLIDNLSILMSYQYLNNIDVLPIPYRCRCCTDTLTRAPLGYFYNAPHWGGLFRAPPSDLRNYWTDSKNSSGIWKPWKNCRRKTNFIDLGVTSDVTGQVKVKMFDISGLVTSASKIAMLSTNKAN